jgi:putative ABC transport system permease protein
MRLLRALLLRLAALLGRRRPDFEIAAELEGYLALHTEENMRRGMTREEARRQAILKLGGVQQTKESYRRQQGLPVLETLWQDLRYGLRMLRKNPGFSAVAIATLALGIGANTAIFTVVESVLLRPLPYEDPGRLMAVYNSAPGKGLPRFPASPPDFRTLRRQNHTLAGLAAFYTANYNLTGTDKPERLSVMVVSAEFFTTLGVQPALGRNFLPGEEKWGSHLVMIVSEGFWRSHLNGDPNLAGKTLHLDGQPYQVVGVMPSSFYTRFPNFQAWVPMAWKPKDNFDSHNNYFVSMIGRLKPGVTQTQAHADLDSIMAAIARQYPENKGIGAGLEPLLEAWVGDARPALLVLLGAVGLVLLIACVNLANLLLARSAGRLKEIGIRSALGANRSRLICQFITESVLLSLLGGGLGLVLAYAALGFLPLASNILPRIEHIHVDAPVLFITLALSLATGALFGLLPALENSRNKKLSESLKEGGRAAQTLGGSNRLRGGLVISEVALALVLLIGSGLALRSLQRLLRVDAGFAPDHVLTFNVSLPDSYDPQPDLTRTGAPPRVAAFHQEFLSRIEQIPGVEAAGAISSLPLQGERWGKFFVALDRALPTSVDNTDNVQYRSVSGHVFTALRIRLVRGRFLDEQDQANSPLSVLVNEALVHKYWPSRDPVGKAILLTPPENVIPPELLPPGRHVPKLTVVGVVADAHYGGLNEQPAPAVYGSILQHDYSMSPAFTIRTSGDPTALVASVRAALARIDKNLPMANISTMDEIMSASVAQPRLEAVLLGVFGGLAMLLAAVGIYGVMSYSVSQRTSEIGIRMALGAERSDVLLLVCKQGLGLAGVGLAAGLALALGATRLMSKVLFGVSPTDPLTFASIMAILAVVALLACYLPARRATKVDPMVALRCE